MSGWIIFLMVAVPVLAGGGLGGFKRRISHNETQLKYTASLSAYMAGTQARKIESLERRVRVLERVATEGNSALAIGIDQLRDERIN